MSKPASRNRLDAEKPAQLRSFARGSPASLYAFGLISMTETTGAAPDKKQIKATDVLSFRPVGRPVLLEDLEHEFRLIRDHLKKPMTPEVSRRICEKSGTHLLKLVSPRTEGDHAIINVQDAISNSRSTPLPSVNAADIPFAKVLFRPLEIMGHSTRSVVDEILNPDDISARVLDAFASVFGEDVLRVVQATLPGERRVIQKLGIGEFPVIFVPRPGGGDLQVTPVSPAAAFMGIKEAIEPFFEKQSKNGPKVPRGKFHKQAVSAKPQNISGAIVGPRIRLMAEMPPGLERSDAELYRFVRGGSFPRWRAQGVDKWILQYADRLDADEKYNNRDTRAALDQTADRLISEAVRFAEETWDEALNMAESDGIDPSAFKPPPDSGLILLRRRWAKDDDYQRSRKALTSDHFLHRLQRHRSGKKGDR